MVLLLDGEAVWWLWVFGIWSAVLPSQRKLISYCYGVLLKFPTDDAGVFGLRFDDASTRELQFSHSCSMVWVLDEIVIQWRRCFIKKSEPALAAIFVFIRISALKFYNWRASKWFLDSKTISLFSWSPPLLRFYYPWWEYHNWTFRQRNSSCVFT